MECSFKAVLRLRRVTDTWELAIQYPNHHHPASSNLSVMYILYTAVRISQLVQMRSSISIGISVRQILTAHRPREAGIALSQHDIWNSRAELRRVLLDGRTPAQALISQMPESDWYVNYPTHDDILTAAFCALLYPVVAVEAVEWTMDMAEVVVVTVQSKVYSNKYDKRN
jgi:hypothetical protein